MMWLWIRDAVAWSVSYTGRIQSIALNRLLLLLFTPFSALRMLAGRVAGRVEMAYMDCVVGTGCTLRCRHCANLMPYCERPRQYSAAQVVESLEKLLQSVDKIQNLCLLGGEPLLNPELDTIVEWVLAYPGVHRVQVITNGTLLPSRKLLRALRHPRLLVVISDYGDASRRADELAAVLEQNGVQFTRPVFRYWRDYGGPAPRGRSVSQLERVYRGCRSFHCRTLNLGQLHLCPCSAMGQAFGLIDAHGDYVDVQAAGSRKTRRDVARLLWKKRWIHACDHCDNSRVLPMKKIPPAQQDTAPTQARKTGA